MKIQFLGTAASPSTPLPFCQCSVCKTARLIGGKNLRRRSSVLVNRDLLVDMGPDIMSSSYDFGVSFTDVTLCLQTHFHEDHFDPEMVISRHIDYGSQKLNLINLAASKQTLEFMDSIIGRRSDYGSLFDEDVAESLSIKLTVMRPYEGLSQSGYKIIGLPANHGKPEHGCFNFMIEDDNSCLLYFTDTSIIDDNVWAFLSNSGIEADLVVLDCTYGIGFDSRTGDHLALKDFVHHVRRFKDEGILKKSGQVYASHISHEGLLEHNAYDEYGKSNGFRVAYDGLVLNI